MVLARTNVNLQFVPMSEILFMKWPRRGAPAKLIMVGEEGISILLAICNSARNIFLRAALIFEPIYTMLFAKRGIYDAPVRKPAIVGLVINKMVPQDGLEPSRDCSHRILSPACLPIPPLRLQLIYTT